MSLAIPPARFALTTLIAARLSPAPAEVRHICPPQPLFYTLPGAIVRAAAEVAAAALLAVVTLLRATSSFAWLQRKSSANQPSGSDPLTLPFTQPLSREPWSMTTLSPSRSALMQCRHGASSGVVPHVILAQGLV